MTQEPSPRAVYTTPGTPPWPWTLASIGARVHRTRHAEAALRFFMTSVPGAPQGLSPTPFWRGGRPARVRHVDCRAPVRPQALADREPDLRGVLPACYLPSEEDSTRDVVLVLWLPRLGTRRRGQTAASWSLPPLRTAAPALCHRIGGAAQIRAIERRLLIRSTSPRWLRTACWGHP